MRVARRGDRAADPGGKEGGAGVSEKIDSFLEAFFLPSFLLSIRCFFGNILGCLLVVFFHIRLSNLTPSFGKENGGVIGQCEVSSCERYTLSILHDVRGPAFSKVTKFMGFVQVLG